jgi:hypothetical protein
MKPSSWSQHAGVRCQKRALSSLVLDCLQQFGQEVHDHHGCVMYHFTKRSLRALERSWGREPVRRLLYDQRAAYAVVASDGTVVTAGWRTRRFKQP